MLTTTLIVIALCAGTAIGMVLGILAVALVKAGKEKYDYSFLGIDESKTVVYISGQMSNMSEGESRHKFFIAEQYLKDKGYEVINPWNIQRGKMTWAGYMLDDIRIIDRYANAMYMLDNWRQSNGAITEHYFAKGSGISIFYQDENLI